MAKTTLQEVFDRVYLGLMEQGRRSTGRHGLCTLRGDDGMKCAIGLLISDEKYERRCPEYYAFDAGKTRAQWHESLLRDYIDPCDGLTSDFLSAIQFAHDDIRVSSPEEFRVELRRNMRRVARNFGLEVPRWNPQLD